MTTGDRTTFSKIADFFDAHKLLIFFVPFFIYILNGREISSGDPTPTVFVAINFVKHGTVFLDDLHDYIPYHKTPYYASEQNGRIVSNYPVFPGIMASPIYAPFVWMGMLEKGSGRLGLELPLQTFRRLLHGAFCFVYVPDRKAFTR